MYFATYFSRLTQPDLWLYPGSADQVRLVQWLFKVIFGAKVRRSKLHCGTATLNDLRMCGLVSHFRITKWQLSSWSSDWNTCQKWLRLLPTDSYVVGNKQDNSGKPLDFDLWPYVPNWRLNCHLHLKMADQQNQMSQNFVSSPNYGAPPNQSFNSGPPPMPGEYLTHPGYVISAKKSGISLGGSLYSLLDLHQNHHNWMLFITQTDQA